MTVLGANSTDGPWTTLHSFSDMTNWDMGEQKIWPADICVGPFRVFRFTTRRIQNSAATLHSISQAHLYAAALTELDEYAAGVHNCDPQATCANTNGSFACSCNTGFGGDGVACSLQLFPSDIGKGDT
uniref:EGF-like domain-containing protein n=1 Tax=Chromera velia CCMP2878 TaxID=1169474 RepID=A0A0G4HT89_9ALVE|eukprot:Cvel_8413.t1-p1 / transcript=Cvel_8413.t1 / gene=Cvel_8413 / organism=Chromera_velia_CCMP2878 / gene_product=Fibrillin-1, putative / transcript_product=Fibrillin-1, putative / location=Cvel_scaffold464:70291-70925(-) / protein_length=127 / sequence_SO=supercontig / SO=protein_coding / is_pseudo=false